MPTTKFEIHGLDETLETLDDFKDSVRSQGRQAVQFACEGGAFLIQNFYTGPTKGFYDNTGQLRKSIKGQFLYENPDEIEGAVSAGDNRIGTAGKPTREYAPVVESMRKKAFLRPGMVEFASQMGQIIFQQLKPERLKRQERMRDTMEAEFNRALSFPSPMD